MSDSVLSSSKGFLPASFDFYVYETVAKVLLKSANLQLFLIKPQDVKKASATGKSLYFVLPFTYKPPTLLESIRHEICNNF